MPNNDTTGPRGAGAMTGRKKGRCAGGQDLGCGCGGHSRGRGRCQTNALPREERRDHIEREIAALKKELEKLDV